VENHFPWENHFPPTKHTLKLEERSQKGKKMEGWNKKLNTE